MTTLAAPTVPNRVRPRLAASRPRRETVQLIAAAQQGRITRELRRPWPVFLVNDRPNADARPHITDLIKDGLLEVVDLHSPTSEVRPTAAGLSKIGAFA